MSTTLLALFRRPEGGDEAMAAFRYRYATEHLPLIRQVPGLRQLRVDRVTQAFGEADLFQVAVMVFDDRPSFDVALASEPMRAAGRNLREIAPGLVTMVVIEPDPEFADGGEGSRP